VALFFVLLDNLVNVHAGILAPDRSKTCRFTSSPSCRKDIKRKLEQGLVDHELDVRCKVNENGRVAADPETLRLLKQFPEREIEDGTGLLHTRGFGCCGTADRDAEYL
jgi:hypothetical protein